MRKNKLTVIIDFENGTVVPENKVLSFIESQINSDVQEFTVGNSEMLGAFKIAIICEWIDPAVLYFKDGDRIIQIDPATYILDNEQDPLSVQISQEVIRARTSKK